jgi:KDO2-lipid IV(A) lauroyltransferase
VKPRWPLEYAGARLGAALARRVPVARAQALAGAVARRLFDRGGERGRMALANLRIAFPDAPESELRAIARESYAHLAWNALDLLRAEAWSAPELRAHFDFRGLEHLDSALARGKGAFLLSAHLGNFDLAGRALAARGYAVSAVLRAQRNPWIWRRLTAERARVGVRSIDHRRALGPILRALRAGGAIAILNDQYSRRSQGVLVPFFGVRASTSAGLATLALRTGAPILPSFATRDGADHHSVAIEPPIEPPVAGERDAAIAELTARCNAAIEAAIRKHPEQYMWAQRRFRHSPDLARDLYAAPTC